MKLWKRDTKNMTVREVDGEPWPGTDAEGETCYQNTHFATRDEAVDSLRREVAARVYLAASRVTNALNDLAQANAEAGHAAIAFQTAIQNIEAANACGEPGLTESGKD